MMSLHVAQLLRNQSLLGVYPCRRYTLDWLPVYQRHTYCSDRRPFALTFTSSLNGNLTQACLRGIQASESPHHQTTVQLVNYI